MRVTELIRVKSDEKLLRKGGVWVKKQISRELAPILTIRATNLRI